MTNLSKELCEICGIKPQEVKYCFWECKNPELENKPCNNTECPYYRDNKYYINFKKPENFIKLLNLPTETIIKNGQTIPAKNIWWIVNMDAKNCEALAPYYFEDLLTHLIVILENENKIYSDEFVNRIKQAIRETEWVYD